MKTTCQQHPIGSHAARFKEQLLRQQSRGGFTLTELFVVIAIVAMLAATLLPALAASKDRSKRAECASNLRQICVATFIYAADRNDYLPPLKWRDQNLQYPYEMFRYTPVNVTPPTYDSAGGPYNLGTLWQYNVLVDGKIYYCPAHLNNDQLSYAYYSVKTNWPFGGDPGAVSNPGYVRAGYTYYPQSRKTQTLIITGLGKKSVPFWPDYSTSPDPNKSWICVPPFKVTDIDQSKSMVTDDFHSGMAGVSHKLGTTTLGLNAGFGDGHVAWQGVNQNPAAFDPNLWATIQNGGRHQRSGGRL